MAVLLMRLQGPFQSWGTQGRFTIRDTCREPTKSGVIGLLCCALGREREAPLDDLASLVMGIRVDQEGIPERDYHTAQNILKTKGSGLKETELSSRFYLAGANFLVALEGETSLLRELHEALRNPRWPLFLGRKAFVPGLPVYIPGGLRENQFLNEALLGYKIQREDNPGETEPKRENFRYLLEDRDGETVLNDQPVSFASEDRRYLSRRVKITWQETEVYNGCISQNL